MLVFSFERAHRAKSSRPVIGTPRKIERVSLVREKRMKKEANFRLNRERSIRRRPIPRIFPTDFRSHE